MVIIGNTVVSLDILEKEFCCDLDTCRGCCCIEGDAGAPLTEEENARLQEMLPILLPEMTPEARKAVEERGISYRDPEGELVTQIVDGKDCVFSRVDHNGWCYCLIEKAFRAGKTDFLKPVSCHLYPIRVKEFDARGDAPAMSALEYHRGTSAIAPECLAKRSMSNSTSAYANPSSDASDRNGTTNSALPQNSGKNN